MKKLMIIATVLLLSACSWNQAKEIAGITADTAIVSNDVANLQTEIGLYSDNEGTVEALVQLQTEIKDALKKPVDSITVQSFYFRAKVIYTALSAEIVARQDELTVTQLHKIQQLDTKLMELNRKLISFNGDEDNAKLLTIGSEVLDVLTVSYKVYKAYKGAGL